MKTIFTTIIIGLTAIIVVLTLVEGGFEKISIDAFGFISVYAQK